MKIKRQDKGMVEVVETQQKRRTNWNKRSPILEVLQLYDFILAITEFQSGMPWTVVERLNETYEIICLPEERSIQLPPTFRQLRCCPNRIFVGDDIKLDGGTQDYRIPLHLAIVEGEMRLVEQIVQYRRRMFTSDAYFCAMNFKQYGILEFLFKTEKPSAIIAESLVRNAQRLKDIQAFYCLDKLGVYLPFKSPDQPLDDCRILEFIDTTDPIDAARRAWMAGNLASFEDNLNKYSSKIPKSQRIVELIQDVVQRGTFGYVKILFQNQLLEQNCQVKQRIVQCAASIGRLSCLKNLHADLKYIGSLEYCWEDIFRNRQIQAFEWMLQNKWYNTSGSQWKRICVFNVDIIQQLHEHGVKMSLLVPGTVDAAKFLKDKCDVQFTYEHMDRAILNKLYDVVVYLKKQTFFNGFLQSQLEFAARTGSLDIVQLIYRTGIKNYTEDAVKDAIQNNHLRVVQFLVEVMNLPVPSQGLELALSSNKFSDLDQAPLIKYIVDYSNQTPGHVWKINDRNVFDKCNLGVLEYLVTNCTQLQNDMDLIQYFVKFGRVDLLKRLFDKPHLMGRLHMKAAIFASIRLRTIKIMEYLWAYCKKMSSRNGSKFLAGKVLRDIDELYGNALNYGHFGPWKLK